MMIRRILIFVVAPITMATIWQFREPIVYFMRTLQRLQKVQAIKDAPVTVVRNPNIVPWPEPPKNLIVNDSEHSDSTTSTRILWGYWHTGESDMPNICQLAVKSWQKKNPNWKIIILSDNNYKNYVAVTDLPTTFESLKVQHRSDLIRVAVLLRYGGAYFDVSTFMFKGLDDIWDKSLTATTSTQPPLYLTSTVQLQRTKGMNVANNALIFSPGRNHPVLREYQQKLLDYLENPITSSSAQELQDHPAFQRIAPILFDDPAMGILKEMIVYGANVWLLKDVLQFSKHIQHQQDNVWFLPTRRWTFDFLSLPAIGKKDTDDPSKDPLVTSWNMGQFLWWMICRLQDQFGDDVERSKRLVQQLNVMKVSTDDINFVGDSTDSSNPCLADQPTTISRVYCSGISNDDNEPTATSAQATLDGAVPVQQVLVSSS